jgi:hypothetical protein
MKTAIQLCALGAILSIGSVAYAADNSGNPPGTVQSTDTKTSSAQNNTPRVNPTPNPDPSSKPPETTTVITTGSSCTVGGGNCSK